MIRPHRERMSRKWELFFCILFARGDIYTTQITHKVHHDNQLTELFLMMCIYPTILQKTHTHTHTELFKILFSLLTLSTAFLQKASGPGKNRYIQKIECPPKCNKCWSHIAPFSRLYLVKVVVQLKSQ